MWRPRLAAPGSATNTAGHLTIANPYEVEQWLRVF